jgi:glutamate racemase
LLDGRWWITISESDKMKKKNRSIGVFDSGIGGLTVVKALMKKFPTESITYFGDTARVPYGSKSMEVVQEFAVQNTEFLLERGVKTVIVACNTASAIALDVLKEKFSVPILGMILPGAHKAEKLSKNRKIGVIGTIATIASQSYSKVLFDIDPTLEISSKACPLFVPLAEEGWVDHQATYIIAEEYLAELRNQHIDTLILGCTHYPVLKKTIQRVIGKNVALVDSGEAAALEVEEMLEAHSLLNDSGTEPRYDFFVSDVPQKFKMLGEIFLGKKGLTVTKVHF